MAEQAPPEPSGQLPRSPVGCYVLGALVAIALILAALIIGNAIRSTGNAVSTSVQSANPANVVATIVAPQTPTIIVRPPAIRQVQALADLTTVSTLMSTVVDVQQARIGNIVYEKLILIAC